MLRTCMHALMCVLLCLGCAVCASGQGCADPPCAPNPIPCAHCTGTWTDNYGWTWSLSSNNNPPGIGTYNVSGTLQAPSSDCSVVYQISGEISQTRGQDDVSSGETALSLTGSNPSPSGYCGNTHISDEQGLTAMIANNICDFATGTRTNSDGFNGGVNMTKPSDLPDLFPTQTTADFCWGEQCPPAFQAPWSAFLFEDTIGSSKSMAGRQAYESQGGGSQDNCWFQGSFFPPYGLSGGRLVCGLLQL